MTILPGSELQPDAMISQLIDDLGHKSFARREAACQSLLAHGEQAIPYLESATQHTDREVRTRSTVVLAKLVRGQRRQRLADFAAGGQNELGLPGWKRLHELAGDTPESRRLLVEMLKSNWRFLAQVEQPSAGEAVLHRCEMLEEVIREESRQVDPADVAALLLATSDPCVPVNEECQQKIYNFCYRLPMRTVVQPSADRVDPFRALLASWVSRADDDSRLFYKLSLALRYQLPAGMVPAKLALTRHGVAPYIQQYAILTMLKFGPGNHNALIKNMLDDESVCYRRMNHRTNEVEFESQLRDVALAALLHIYGADPKTHGFTRLRTNSNTVFQPNTLGFVSDTQRQLARAALADIEAQAGLRKTDDSE